MSTELDEALEWFDRADQAREVAGQLIDPAAKEAVLQLAESFDRLGQSCPRPTPREEGGRDDREWGQEPIISRSCCSIEQRVPKGGADEPTKRAPDPGRTGEDHGIAGPVN